MKLIIHACCAPCLTYTYEEFAAHDRTVLWFNPNIHPYKEYENRLKAMERYAELHEVDIVYMGDYDLRGFIRGALEAEDRCSFCYRWRLEESARYAAENGFDGFTTTLTISPYQDHEKIKHIGRSLSREYGVEFFYRDMREGFRKSHRMAREDDLYMQKYCGCIFSEEERYRK